jgi:sulfur-oxidizing protein SoxY
MTIPSFTDRQQLLRPAYRPCGGHFDRARRAALQRAVAGTGAALMLTVLRPADVLAAWNQQAFDAEQLDDALAALGIAAPLRSQDIAMEAPEFADDAAYVPVQVVSGVPGTESIALFVDRNPFPYIARFDVSRGALPRIALRLRVGQSSPLRAVVRAGDRYLYAVREVRVTAGGCGGADGATQAPKAPAPIKIRARLGGDTAEVRVLIPHPMENGLRKDSGGNAIPAHFIRTLVAQLNGRTVFAAEFGRSMSTDPLLAFGIRSTQGGERIAIRWEDNLGMSRSDETTVAAG